LKKSLNVAFWHKAAESDVRSNVSYWELSGLVVLTLSFVGHDPEQKSNAADKAFPLVPLDRTPPRHAVGVPVPQGTVVSQISSNDQGRNRPFSGNRIIVVVVRVSASPRQLGTVLSLTLSGFSSA
jgi:hypothetical protein